MAAEEGVSPFPLPPSDYFKLYTDENVNAGITPEPPPPIEGAYSVFGLQFQTDEPIIRSLEQQHMDRLYPEDFDRQKELKKLNHSLLLNFVELLDILTNEATSPKREKKLGDITVIFINMHHLINELRPHQARETLRVMMERQKQQRLETADKLDKLVDKVVSLIQSCSISLQPESDGAESNVNNATRVKQDICQDSLKKETTNTARNVVVDESDLQTLCDMVDDLT